MGAYDAGYNLEASALSSTATARAVLIIVGVVEDVARANGISSTYPFIAKVLSPTNFIDKLNSVHTVHFNLFTIFLPLSGGGSSQEDGPRS